MSDTSPTLSSAEHSAWSRYKWPVILTTLLLGHSVIIAVALLLSSSMIPGALTAPAGYEEALAWDEQQAALRRSEDLGWALAVIPTDEVLLDGNRKVRFRVVDADGELVPVETLTVRVYRHARPADITELDLSLAADGEFETALPMSREGLYQLHVVATRGEDRFIVDTELWAPKPNRS